MVTALRNTSSSILAASGFFHQDRILTRVGAYAVVCKAIDIHKNTQNPQWRLWTRLESHPDRGNSNNENIRLRHLAWTGPIFRLLKLCSFLSATCSPISPNEAILLETTHLPSTPCRFWMPLSNVIPLGSITGT